MSNIPELIVPKVSEQEIQEAHNALKLQGKVRQTKQNLDQLFDLIRGIEDTNTEPMLLSGQDPEDTLQSQQSNSYVFLLMFSYIRKQSFLEQIMQHFENDEKLQNIGQVIRYNEQFGQVYAVVIITFLLQTFPQRAIDLFIRNGFIGQFVDLIEHNYFSQYEMQLIDLTFQHLDKKDLELSKQTKNQLIEMVQRQFQQKALQGSDFLLVYLRNLKTLIFNENFKEQVILQNSIQTIAVYLSALFFQRYNVSQKFDYSDSEFEQLSILTQIICYIFNAVNDLNDDVERAAQFENILIIIQELDILRIFQTFSAEPRFKVLMADFFGDNAQSRNFSMAVANRFENKEDVKSVCDYAYFMMEGCKDLQIQIDMFNFLTGQCLENDQLLKVVEHPLLLRCIVNTIKYNLISSTVDKFVEPAIGLLKAMFRSPQLFIDYYNLDFAQKDISQMQIFNQHAGSSMLSKDYFKIVLELCQKYPLKDSYVEILYFISQLRVNMMPFVHQVSTLQLLRKKFQVCKEIHLLPEPTDQEMQAFIILLKYRNMKLAGIVPFALYQFLRYENKCKYIISQRKQIIANLEVMVQNLSALNEHMIKNSSLRKAKMGQATRDAIKEALSLLCVICKDVKDRESINQLIKIFEKWTTIAQINQQYAEETVKYIAYIIKNNGKYLKNEIEKIQQIRLIQMNISSE